MKKRSIVRDSKKTSNRSTDIKLVHTLLNNNTKKFIGIILAVLIIGGGILLLLRDDGNSVSHSVSSNLYPEQTISHGHGLAVDVKDSSKLYIATHYGLLVLMNERDLYRIGKSRDDYMGFSPHPTESNLFFTSGHPSSGGNIGFQKSEDGGVTWDKVSNGINGPVDFHAMAVSPVNPNLIYGWYQGHIQRSTNQGGNWEIVKRDLVALYLAADSQDENTVYAATPGGQGVMASHDKGVSWNSLSPDLEGGAVLVIAVHPKNSHVLLAFSEKVGGLGKSMDQGKTWQKVREAFNGETLFHIAFDRNNPSVVYALSHTNKLYKSIDTAESWSLIR